MRTNLTKKNSTRAERVFAQALKELGIPFRHRVQVSQMEVDFLVGGFAFEIDGHRQNEKKNKLLLNAGYVPIHLANNQLKDVDSTKTWLQTLQINKEKFSKITTDK